MTNLRDLITGRTSKDVAVDARGLHDFLEVGKDFSNWIKDMTEYGFSEGQDFTPISAKSRGGRPRIEYAMTLDMAKELAMLQRTDKGKQARRYFIAAENKLRDQEVSKLRLPRTPDEKIQLLLENSGEANKRIDTVEERMDDFEANQKLDPSEYSAISHGVTRAVNRYVDDHRLKLTRDQRSELYKDISNGLNKVVGVHTRTQIRAKDYDTALKFIDDWQPNTATKMLIQQMELPLEA